MPDIMRLYKVRIITRIEHEFELYAEHADEAQRKAEKMAFKDISTDTGELRRLRSTVRWADRDFSFEVNGGARNEALKKLGIPPEEEADV